MTRIEASGRVFLDEFAIYLIDCLQAWGDNVSAADARDFVEYAVRVCGYDDLACWTQFNFPVNNVTKHDVETCIRLYNLMHP